ncbi:MAG: zinc-binding dehydrogenase, partial [Streptomycetaceae bacterium]|nr:zinc-binding dehydrogenase [Streptomycetaceae bacterium]
GAVRNRGGYFSVAGGQFVPLRSITTESVWITADAAQLAEISRLAGTDVGALTPRVADTYTLADAAKAYERVAAGGVRGRLVLIP